ncbi:T9SS type A sorting domain-containing protein [Mucilaginibacter sp. RB4R14]|uniref:T9SS type A sorting domain-containing protein n=1 Tax=Mucilaginibacter aurantiaciroseus TaxID=2949308 RepID=UPI00209148D4|nr:T9SS type A sorting domain-containing protein [Mucilaginibacter aurantiaciroseus]MCO5937385.1 T9SS type A sorting domain-containing protein [Mucilaginibacter aurantiaciroseus]
MKKFIKPGFEFIFSVALIAILGLPPLVLAQSQKNIDIQIVNGDTTVNGKNIKKLTVAERKDALEALNGLSPTPIAPGSPGRSNSKVVIKKRITGGNTNDVVIERSTTGDEPQIAVFDSSRKDVKVRLKRLRGVDSVQAFTYRFDNELPQADLKTFSFNMPKRKQGFEFSSRNSQTFNYSNTDNDGVSTNISFRVSEPPKDKLKRIAGVDKAELVLNDLSLTPEFSTGKTILSFNLPSKTTADIKFTDTEGKVLWADKATTGSFSKKMSLPLNGVYYLHVKLGTGIAVKKIVKE